MRAMHNLNAGYRVGAATPVCMEDAPCRDSPASGDWVAAATDALDVIRGVVSTYCSSHSSALSQDGIMAYALALMRLRECAGAAGFERLTNACDALAVTVAKLIEDRHCARRDTCETLTRFVAHAQAMIEMSAGGAQRRAMPMPDIQHAGDRRAYC